MILISNLKHCILIALFVLIGCKTSNNKIAVTNLKVSGFVENIAVDANKPLLQWNIVSSNEGVSQKAYRILVATDSSKLSQNIGDIWDSGKTESSDNNTLYLGEVLSSNQKYYWKVKIWTQENKSSDWSAPSFWETAIMESEQWRGKWIDDGKENPKNDADFYNEDPAPLFRKEFLLNKDISSAKLYITGLGYYVSYLNGDRIGDNYFDPSWTSYEERIFYSTYDVTNLLNNGENCIAVTLGNGWFNPLPLRMWGHLNLREHLFVGRPAFISELHITLKDGTKEIIYSDETWQVTEGPILKNSIYLGELYDARKEVKNWSSTELEGTENWRNAALSECKFGRLESQPLEPIQITDTIEPIKISEPTKGTYIVDMGINFVGLPKFRFSAERGTKIEMRYGELLTEEGELNPLTSVCGQIKRKGVGGDGAPDIAWQGDTYIAKGENNEEYMPNFSFHGFRYIEIKGLENAPELDDFTGYRLYSNVREVGRFECSDSMFNQIQEMCNNTFISNIIGVQSDCPHRERFGYGGDIVATSEAFMYNYDMSLFYEKTATDWLDSRIDKTRFTDTAPFVGIDYCGLGWAMTNPLLQLQLYRYYGNKSIIEDNYNAARVWIEQIIKDNPDNIIKKGLNDHESLDPASSDMMVTPLYYQSVEIIESLAKILGKDDDVLRYNTLKKEISKSYTDKFLSKETGRVGAGTQALQSFALYTGIIPTEYHEKIMKYLVFDIIKKHNNHLTTGIIGTKFMLDMLSKHGYHDIAMTITSQKDFPSWGNMLQNGATTLWEHWNYSDNTYSHNHPMFGSISEWFFKWIGGIQLSDDAVGFNSIVINPQIKKTNLDWSNCSYNSINGDIVSNWKKENGVITMEIEIPNNTKATIILPSGVESDIECNGAGIRDNKGVTEISIFEQTTQCKVKPGKYKFIIK